jgi:transposase-like protein
MLDEIVQTRRNTKAAKRLLIRLLKKQGLAPKHIITDRLRSYRRQNVCRLAFNYENAESVISKKLETGNFSGVMRLGVAAVWA